jgi:hypothetical protein
MKKNYSSYSSSKLPACVGNPFGIQTPELREIVFPLQKLLEKMRSRFATGQYTVMIGDDASGRVPALILNQLQNMCGMKKTPLYFIAGSRKTKTKEAKKAEIKAFLQKKMLLSSETSSVLIVTEFIHHGGSLSLLTDVLRSLKIAYNVCTIGVFHKASTTSLGVKLGTKILYGVKGKPALDGHYVLAGVQKSYEDLLATRYPMTRKQRATFCKSRKDVTRIAQILHQQFF